MKINATLHVVPKGVKCPYDLILGLDVLRDIGIAPDCKNDTITWDSSVTDFKTASTLKIFDQLDIISIEINTPPIIHKVEQEYDRKISSNTYSSKNWKMAIQNSKHLTPSERQKCWVLLGKNEDILQGQLGTFPGPPCKINLK